MSIHAGINVTADDPKALVLQWLQQCVVGLSLCPYARAPLAAGQVRLVECQTSDDLIEKLLAEARELLGDATVETTLVIAPAGHEGFLQFNDVAGDAEDALVESELDQHFQLASFHPDYLFAEDPADDAAHFTNRAPCPILQLLRVETVAKAVDGGDTLQIPVRNCEQLRSLPKAALRELFPWSAHWIE